MKCVGALREQTYPADKTEIVVVDNTPEFELSERAEMLAPARVLHEPLKGSYAARNCGIDNSTGEILAFTDADCIPAPDWAGRGGAGT